MRRELRRSLTVCLACLALMGCEPYFAGGSGKGAKPADPDIESASTPAESTEWGASAPDVSQNGSGSLSRPDSGAAGSSATVDGTSSPSPVQLTGAESAAAEPAPTRLNPAATADSPGDSTSPGDAVAAADSRPDQLPQRTFRAEGPGNALRISFDDLDLLKLLKMEPVTPDCIEKMPAWLRELNGKPVRIRGFMKPGLLSAGIPQFLLVRDTGLCCFGPAGKIYDLIAVTLAEGTTTDYIELRPFDVVGTFRIHLELLEDEGLIFGLYYIDNAKIIQK